MAPPSEIPGGHRAPEGSPPFPGGIGVTHLRVYRSASIDGLAGGTPHCHTACTEAYAVIRGRGRVLSLGGDGAKETVLEPGSFAWFTPGTIHRLVNDSGDLEILVLMANAGLPEAGDMVITFPDDHLADPDRYRAAATLPDGHQLTGGADRDGAVDDPAVIARKDLAVAGMAELLAGGPEALERFHRRAAALVAPLADGWRPVWEAGPVAAVEATATQLAALAAGDGSHLGDGGIWSVPPPPAVRRHGCCGTLGVIVPASAAGR